MKLLPAANHLPSITPKTDFQTPLYIIRIYLSKWAKPAPLRSWSSLD